MRATLNIPDDLLEEVRRTTKVKSKTQAIVLALRDYLRHKKTKLLLEMEGKVDFDLSHEEQEATELKAQKKRRRFLGRTK